MAIQKLEHGIKPENSMLKSLQLPIIMKKKTKKKGCPKTKASKVVTLHIL